MKNDFLLQTQNIHRLLSINLYYQGSIALDTDIGLHGFNPLGMIFHKTFIIGFQMFLLCKMDRTDDNTR